MVTLNKVGYHNNLRNAEFYGNSSDIKPIEEVPNGSVYFEMDTSLTYLFDEENKVWHQQ